jgi:hypothetical protein
MYFSERKRGRQVNILRLANDVSRAGYLGLGSDHLDITNDKA